MTEQITVEGAVQSVIFRNEENGYTVLRLVDIEGQEHTVVGCIPFAAAGEQLTVTGTFTTHPTYGAQLVADAVERRMPEQEADILAYLASGALRGVGAATAARLVERFGCDTLHIIEAAPEKLTVIKGITARKAMEMSEALRAMTCLRRMAEFLSLYELPPSLAMFLVRTYGDDAVEKVKDNPYLLVDERCGVAFSTADEIAVSMGFEAEEPRRVEAAILYELRHNMGNGHVFLPREKLLHATAQLLAVEETAAQSALETLTRRGEVVCAAIANVEGCYLRRLYEAETYVARRLSDACRRGWDSGRNAVPIIAEIEAQQGIAYAPQQRRAVELAAQQGVLVLTGGPGTGKTTATRGIVTLLERMGLQVLLLAPTGRAAQRMGQLCGREAQTIHRCLGMSYNELTGEVTFRKNEKEPLEANAIIVDEMSMVDLELMAALLRATRDDCRLVLVGDSDQLPSVGPGNVLGDLLKSQAVPAVTLTEIFRQADTSAIVRNAHAVNAGQPPDLDNRQGDFFFLRRRAPETLVDTVVSLCRERLPDNMGIPAAEIQVLSPTRKGVCGTANLNRALQAALNPPAADKRQMQWGNTVFRQGDRVMQTKNNYDVVWYRDDGSSGSGVFNGDVGLIGEIDPSGELLTVRFDDRTAQYSVDMLAQLELAYAITVHKAQGSEYRAVVLVSAPAAPGLMVRGVLYTAITRARELLVLVGDETIPGKMAENDKTPRRYSGLRRRLKEATEQWV